MLLLSFSSDLFPSANKSIKVKCLVSPEDAGTGTVEKGTVVRRKCLLQHISYQVKDLIHIYIYIYIYKCGGKVYLGIKCSMLW